MTREREEVQAWLVGSRWNCVPVATAQPAVLSVEFGTDGTGKTMYERAGVGRVVPDLFDVDWVWSLESSSNELQTLRMVWQGANEVLVNFDLQEVEFVAQIRDGGTATFFRRLVPTRHLFPLESDFPDGWPCEYFGYSDEEVT